MIDQSVRPVHAGAIVTRKEDQRLLSGQGRYVADIVLPNIVDVAVVRSPFAHARIRNIDIDVARKAAGVVAVYTAADLADVSAFPDYMDFAKPVHAFPLARERVRYVGTPVAAVVATDRYLAEDAAELVGLDLDPLPVVTSPDEALAAGAPRLYDEWPDNVIVESVQVRPEVDQLFESHTVVRGTYRSHRHTAVPIETRGTVAEFRHGRLTVWTTTQSPHIVRTVIATMLGLGERSVRVIAPDIGGGFGGKTHVYAEEVLVAWLAIKLNRPVRWIEDRREHLIGSSHAREQVQELEAAVDETGRVMALRARIVADLGSGEILPPGIAPSFVSSANLTGPYRIPLAKSTVVCVATNKTPSGAYRGFGAPEMVFAVERLIEKIAHEVGRDPLDLRRDMLLNEEDLPYVNAAGSRIDSGSHRQAFERAVEIGRSSMSHREPSSDNHRIGLGVATFIEGVGPSYYATSGHWTSHDSAMVRVDPDGGVFVTSGVTTTGQGVETMVATLAADALGVPFDQVTVVLGDTDLCPYGLGGWGSRSTIIGGGAVLEAASIVRAKMLAIAGHLLEAATEDLVIEEGSFRVRGVEHPGVSFADVATAAYVRTYELPPELEPGLEATATWDPPGIDHWPNADGLMNACASYTNATHVAVVEVDLETGQLEILDYIVVHDAGRIINPQIVDGQIHGGVAQGIGGACYEHLPYDAEGQPLATSLMDYLLPSATEIPPMTVEHIQTLSPVTPLGVKGVGEAGTLGPAAAIANAVCNALREFGVDEIRETPITPSTIRYLLRRTRGETS